MGTFTVDAQDSKGKKIRAEVQAESVNDAIAKIKGRGFQPLKVTPKDGAAGGTATATAPPKDAPAKDAGKGGGSPMMGAPPPRRKKGFSFGGKVKSKQLCQFTVQLSVLMNAGLPIVRSLKILGAQLKPGTLKTTVVEMAEDVEQGSSLSEAMSKHPKAFDKLYCNMVHAGEAGGVLDVILDRLAKFLEKIEALKRKIVAASIYPSVVITIAVTVVLCIMTFIVPKFAEVFKAVNVEMPAPTVLLMATSDFIMSFWWLILAMPFGAFFGFKAWSRTKSGRFYVDKLKLSAPLFGNIIKKAVIARFCRTLGTLLQSGVPILEALNIVRGTVGNEIVAAAISKVHDSVKEGETIAAPLGEAAVFDDIVVNMIDVGEETGELDKMLMKIADNYDNEVDAAVSGLVSIMEPLLIVGLGVTVGFIVVSLFLPLVALLQGIKA